MSDVEEMPWDSSYDRVLLGGAKIQQSLKNTKQYSESISTTTMKRRQFLKGAFNRGHEMSAVVKKHLPQLPRTLDVVPRRGTYANQQLLIFFLVCVSHGVGLMLINSFYFLCPTAWD